MTETIISTIVKATHNRMIAFDLRRVTGVEDHLYEIEVSLIGAEGVEYKTEEKYKSLESALAYLKAYLFEDRPVKFLLPIDNNNGDADYVCYYVDNEYQELMDMDAKKDDN